MRSLIFYCNDCEQYTFNPVCSSCKKPTTNPAPARFSPEDKYGKYRRMLKLEQKT